MSHCTHGQGRPGREVETAQDIGVHSEDRKDGGSNEEVEEKNDHPIDEGIIALVLRTTYF